MNGLDGKVAIVTGGGSGLGEAIGKALAHRGVKVVLSDINLNGCRAGRGGDPRRRRDGRSGQARHRQTPSDSRDAS